MSGTLYEGFVPGRHLLDAVGNGGFRFADMSHRGSILILPSGIHAWDAFTPADFTVDAFNAVIAEASGIDFLLIGTGKNPAFIEESLKWRFREAHIGFDAMTTTAAARTYNVLANEGRRVAAALLVVD